MNCNKEVYQIKDTLIKDIQDLIDRIENRNTDRENEIENLKSQNERLINKISNLEKTIKNKDNQIDLMAKSIDNYDCQLEICQFNDKEEIKEYFEEISKSSEIKFYSEASSKFKELGYKEIEKKDKDLFLYKFYKDYNNVIYFYENKTVNKTGEYDGMCDPLTIEEINAINKKIEELGWTDKCIEDNTISKVVIHKYNI